MKNHITIFFLLICCFSKAQDKQIYLYDGIPSGSEKWNWEEKTEVTDFDKETITNVTRPTLTVYRPSKPNGTAVIIAPGGAFHFLVFDLEGSNAAKWLNEKGITVFVLKYRLVHDNPTKPEEGYKYLIQNNNIKKLLSNAAPVVPLALQDGLTAIKYVRDHARNYNINTAKIGFMGFSAGGTLTMAVAYNATDENRPNFVVPIYAYEGLIIGSTVPKVKTPIFIVATSDDKLVPPIHSVNIYSKWLEAQQPAELHMYEKGNHGFNTKKQNLPVDTWLDRFGDWLKTHGFLTN